MFKTEKQKKTVIVIMFALLLCAQLAVCLYFGSRKSGFHEDEFYSFYSTNKTAGLFVGDREWQERDQYRNEFVVLPGETFRYGIVAKMQSWDVHPPLYYFLLHTASSLFTGVFSKWIGIGVNLIAFVINFFLLMDLTRKTGGEKNWTLTWLVCAIWGFAPAVVSGVLFIRMYEWLTLFVLLCACIHVRAVKEQKMRLLTFYLPLAVTVYLGFLTQYYYIIFHIFMGIGFCAWLLFSHTRQSLKKGLILCLKYGTACAVGLGAAIVSYPASLSHIFRGYRGTEAVSEFSNVSNTWERLRFFYGLLNDYVFGGTLLIWLLLVAFICITAAIKQRRFEKTECPSDITTRKPGMQNAEGYFVLLLACLGYFFTISKTALLLGVTSNRYQLPIYGIAILLVIIPLFEKGMPDRGGKGVTKLLGVTCLLVLLMINLKGLFTENKVFFLYPEEAGIMAYVKENTDADVVIFYNEDSPANIWRLSDELMEYERIYLVSQGNLEALNDEIIKNSDKLVVYIADCEGAGLYEKMIFAANTGLTEQKMIAQKELWTLYEYD